MPRHPTTAAMDKIAKILESLEPHAREFVLRWIVSEYLRDE